MAYMREKIAGFFRAIATWRDLRQRDRIIRMFNSLSPEDKAKAAAKIHAILDRSENKYVKKVNG